MLPHTLVRDVFLPKREDCFGYLRNIRWKNGVQCPYCHSTHIWREGATPKGALKYRCRGCNRYFNDLTGTIFENRKFSLEEMFYIVKEMEHKSTSQIAKEIDRDYDSVLNFVHDVQEIASKYARGITIEGIVEIDEIYVHSGNKGKRQDKPRTRGLRKPGRGTWEGDKPPVVTIVKRGQDQRSGS